VNIFSSEPFLSALRDSWFGGEGDIGAVDVAGVTVRTLLTRRGPCLDHLLVDFFEPVEREPVPAVHARFAPRVCVDRISKDGWPAAALGGATPAPTVDWSRFASWERFEEHARGTVKRLWASDRWARRRLEDEVGPVHTERLDGAILEQCLRWKSAQYRRTGAKDLFADRRNVQLVARAVADGIGDVHALFAGDVVIAAQVGLHHAGRSYSWFPAYDGTYHRYSPGRLLLHDVLRASYARGDSEFDFLIGDEDYKWLYATDARLIAPVGRPGLAHRAHDLRVQLSRRYPRANRAAKRALRRGQRIQSQLRPGPR
jgi:CelD/BcsL family acetyltransferase involved in cellulose biosynthesis